jgi:hypothetical protein
MVPIQNLFLERTRIKNHFILEPFYLFPIGRAHLANSKTCKKLVNKKFVNDQMRMSRWSKTTVPDDDLH